MKNKYKVLASILGVSILIQGTVMATNATSPGSYDDPVVSKSYVDGLMGDVLQDILKLQQESEQLRNELDIIENTFANSEINIDNNTEETTDNDNDEIKIPVQNYTYKPVKLTRNQLLLGGEGTEVILRSGSATAYTESANGLSDVTSGDELMNGDNIPLNHVLVIPRDDNRGFTVTETEAWILIRGDYTIINR